MSLTPAARARGLTVRYGDHVVVAPSDFTIPAGRLAAIIGPNGSGKSTLLNAFTGLAGEAYGSLEVLGAEPERSRARIAYVLQATKVNEVMPVTVREVVAMGRYARLGALTAFGVGDRRARDAALDRLGILGLAHSHLTELSGGQRQIVFVAQGLAQEADLLLLDEPLTGLDLVSRDRILTAMQDELERGVSVVFTTHDLSEASAADYVLLMSGRVLAEGPPTEVLAPDRLSEAYGIGILHLEDGSIVLDDAYHRHQKRHVHFERGPG